MQRQHSFSPLLETHSPSSGQKTARRDLLLVDQSRMIALAPKTETLHCMAFVDRGEVRRVISPRRTNRREVKHHVRSL